MKQITMFSKVDRLMLAIDERHRPWWILAATGCVLGLIVLDETVVGVALPTIQTQLGMTQTASHWIINAYLLVFTCLVAAGGKLDASIDLTKVFLIGLVIFGLSSLAAGFAEDGLMLIGLRACQGIGAALVFPAATTMTTEAFPPERRGLAFGIQGGIGATFLALGPFVGGLFTEVLSWRWIFWINPLVTIVVAFIIVIAWKSLPRQGPVPHIDRLGLVILIMGLSTLVMGLMQGPQWGWSSAVIIGLLASGAIILLLFVLTELRVSEPLIEMDLFRNSTFSASNLIIFMAQFNKLAIVVFGALYFQQVLHMSPLTTGIALLPGAAMIPISAVPAGRLTDRYGERWLCLGALLLSGLSFLWLGFWIAQELYWPFVPALIIWGLTLPFLFLGPQRTVMNAVPQAKHGQAGGISLTFRLLGGTFGVAICGAALVSLGDFQPIFFLTGIFSLVVLVIGWFFIKQGD